jgi:TRAP-type C4-dicarboxylate transport system permease small subunit
MAAQTDPPPQTSASFLDERAPTSGPARMLLAASFVAGSIALVGMLSLDFVAVICRNIGVPLVGAVELIQFCIVFAISAGLVAATLTRGHATVHLLLERLTPVWRRRFERAADLLAVVFFACLAFGDAWLIYDTWAHNERTDLLRLPILPMRLVWTASLVLVAFLCLRALFKREPINTPSPEDPS